MSWCPVLQLSEREVSALYNTMCGLESRWIPSVSGEGREGSHPAVSFPLWSFVRGIQRAEAYFIEKRLGRMPRFLDVGCGIGTKVLLVQQWGWEADGLDFVPEYCEAARELCGALSAITCVDAREYDNYGTYDLVYAYRPLVDMDETMKLTIWMAEQLKPGALMFLAWWPEFDSSLLEKISDEILDRQLAISQGGLWMRV